MNELTKKDITAIDCMTQHIKVFLELCHKSEIADFGKPCEECPHVMECDFEWLEKMYPITKYASIGISINLNRD